jgi:O-antigen/teichoic acid export membrane protein
LKHCWDFTGGAASPHLRAAARSVGAKALTLPVTAVTMLLTTRAVVDSIGVAGYALFALAVTLPAILPLGDLGVGAAIVEAMASSREREQLRRAITSGARTLLCAGALIACVGILPALGGWWAPMLGRTAQPGTDAAVAVTFSLFGCSLFLSLGKSLLVALNRTHMTLLFQGAGSVLALFLTLACVASHAPAAVLVAPGFLGQCLVGLVCLAWASRLLHMPVLGLVLGCWRQSRAGTRIRHLAGPMAVINAGSTIAYSTDRLVLSHTTDSAVVAAYSAGAQLFTPAMGLLSVAGLPLWVLFAHQRDTADQPGRRKLMALTAYFGLGGLVVGLGLILIGPTVGSWMMHDRTEVGTGLIAAFAALLVAQAVNYPASMWLTDATGLRFQAIRVSIMATANLALSIPLAHLLGAPGPVLASAIALIVAVLIPTLRRALSHA